MAHALRRISYATCDPDYYQFAFLAREPRAQPNIQYCHAFVTKTTSEVCFFIRIFLLPTASPQLYFLNCIDMHLHLRRIFRFQSFKPKWVPISCLPFKLNRFFTLRSIYGAWAWLFPRVFCCALIIIRIY